VAEAAKGSSEIAQNITAVAQAAQSTTQGAGNVQQSAGELSRMAADLQELVSQFKASLGEEDLPSQKEPAGRGASRGEPARVSRATQPERAIHPSGRAKAALTAKVR
jgi:fumarate hydratase class II